jgi:hypothetical protein
LRVQKLLAGGSPEDLEAEVRRSLSPLEQLKISVSSHAETSLETQQWLQQIETLKLQNANEPIIIGDQADIEFIQSTDWEMELGILFAELLDGNGKISREAGSDAAMQILELVLLMPKSTQSTQIKPRTTS